jgi:hypothetical protein
MHVTSCKWRLTASHCQAAAIPPRAVLPRPAMRPLSTALPLPHARPQGKHAGGDRCDTLQGTFLRSIQACPLD